VEDAFFFAHGDGRLFAVAHPPQGTPTGLGVVLCHPFAEERQLADRILVHCARALAGAGIAALRFDQRGHGDSDGDLADGTFETYIAGIRAATTQLAERFRVEAIVLLGLRLGATLAALVAERDPRVTGLVLWSPVLSGRPYVRDLLRKTIAMHLSANGNTPTIDRLTETIRTDGRLEFDGDFLTRAMFDDLSALDLAGRVARFGGPVMISALRTRSGQYAAYDALLENYHGRTADALLVPTNTPEYWDVRSMFDGIFPDDLYAATLEWLGARWPAGG
jgi:exosortase A-associated hydrolase 2